MVTRHYYTRMSTFVALQENARSVKYTTAQFCSLFAGKKNLGAFMMCEKDIMGQTLHIQGKTFIATKKRHLIIKINI